MSALLYSLAHEEDTLQFSQALADIVVGGLSLYLSGPLGAGKSCLARGILRRLGVGGHIKSPSYSIIEMYDTPHLTIYHMDCYRLHDAEEADNLGLRDMLADSAALFLIEWPENLAGYLPEPDIAIMLQIQGTGRQITLSPQTPLGQRQLQQLNDVKYLDKLV